MRKTDTHTNDFPDKFRYEIPWKESKEDIWNKTFANLPELQEVKRVSLFQRSLLKYSSIAAVTAIVMLISGMWFYTKTVSAPIASRENVMLPDGSSVYLNAETKISYKPYWWKISREVKLEGEAFFEVQKGNRFTVLSEAASTTVLGTSFNIYARNDGYEATCLTGKVKVASKSGDKVVYLTPDMQAFLTNGILLKKNIDAGRSISWRRNEFYFTSAPLSKVLNEIARQYGVKIEFQGDFNEQYTGNFSKELSIKEVLNLVCLPFGVNFTAINSNRFLISE